MIALILALIAVESSGDPNAIGDGGKAYGLLQMHSAYVQDAAEWAGKDWTHEDAFDPYKARRIFMAYMDRYARESKRPSDMSQEEFISRIHHGGPTGYLKESTIPYWQKVKKHLTDPTR